MSQCVSCNMLSCCTEQTTRAGVVNKQIMDNEAIIAVKAGDLTKLKELLDQGLNINNRDDDGRTLLHHAAINGQHEVVKYLLENGADVLITTEKNNTALHIAISNNKDNVVSVMLEKIARSKLRILLDTKTKATGTTALHVAAKNDNYTGVSILLKYGANFEIKNDAGEKATDMTKNEDILKLFQLIDQSFTIARKSGKLSLDEDEQLADSLDDNCKTQDFISVMNCRNNEGYTIVQVLVLNEHYRLASFLLWSRVIQSINSENEYLNDLSRRDEVEKLAKGAREFRKCWEEQRKALMKIIESMKKEELENSNIHTSHAVELSSCLKKSHEVLLTYREFEGVDKTLTTDPRIKTLEEVLEALGFDSENRYVNDGAEASYFENLPTRLKENINSFMLLMDSVIDPSIDLYLGNIYAIQSFTAVKENDIDKVQQLIDMKVFNHGVDRHSRTPLCYAVDNRNEKMVHLLLSTNGRVTRENAESPIYLTVSKGDTKFAKLLLESASKNRTEAPVLPEFLNQRGKFENTALHEAAKRGDFDMVKTLLSYGATYKITDGEGHTPLDVSTKQEISDFLKLIDDCFKDTYQAKIDVVQKLEALHAADFKAVINARNLDGKTLAEVADKCKAKAITEAIDKLNLKD